MNSFKIIFIHYIIGIVQYKNAFNLNAEWKR